MIQAYPGDAYLPATRSGWLLKTIPQGKAKKRFLLLRGRTLFDFGEKESTPKAVLVLMDAQVQLGQSNRIQISSPDSGTWDITAPDERMAQLWIAALQPVTTSTLLDNLPLPPLDLRLPKFAEVPASQCPELCRRKVGLCCLMASYADPDSDKAFKDAKRNTLLELVEHCDESRDLFTADPHIYGNLISMIGLNIFRELPPKVQDIDEEDEDEPVMEPAWPHLSIVYELLLHLVLTPKMETKAKKKHLDAKFVARLVQLFESQDMRERDYLKTITHRVYGKLTNRRAHIRRQISYVFYTYIYEAETFSGVSELLEILGSSGSIINGFAVPVKEEHRQLLLKALIPMHSVLVGKVQHFHQQLSYCVTQFVTKDPMLSEHVIRGLVRYWPNANSFKQLLFLNEIEDLFECIHPDVVRLFSGVLSPRLAKCIGSEQFQVSERTLGLWNSPNFMQMMVDESEHRAATFPVLFPALEQVSREHWNDNIRLLAEQILNCYRETDPQLYAQLSSSA